MPPASSGRSRRSSNSRRAGPSRSASGVGPVTRDADEELKLLVRLVWRAQGYWTDLAVPLRVPTYSAHYRERDATDADVVAMGLLPDLTTERLVAECKSSDSGSMEELLKLGSVVEILQANRGWFVKTSVSDHSREVARRLPVKTIARSDLDVIVASFTSEPSENLARERLIYRSELEHRTAMSRADEGRRILKYCEAEYWTRENWSNTHNLVFLLGKCESMRNRGEDVSQYAVLWPASLLVLSMVRLAGEAFAWSAANSNRAVELFVFGGPTARRERERLFDLFRQVSQPGLFDEAPMDPEFLPAAQDLVDSYLRFLPHLTDVVGLLDALCVAVLLEEDVSDVTASGAWSDVTIKLAKDGLEFALRAASMDSSVLASVLSA
jgi:hypothetical protein